MGLISSIAKIGVKAFKYGKRALNCAPEFIFGESSEAISKAYKAAPKGSVFSKAKTSLKAFESHVGTLKTTQGGFFTRLYKNTKDFFPDLWKAGKAGAQGAKTLGKSGIWGGIKGVGSVVAKKMPYIGAVLTLLYEAPNIYKGYKKEGITGAAKQAGGATIELGCMAAGAAIGSCICPGPGSLVGGIIGGLVGWGVRALTFPEPKDEDEETTSDDAEQVQQNQDTETEAESSSDGSSLSGASTDTTTVTGSSVPSVPYPTATGMTNPFGAGLSVPNPVSIGFGAGAGLGNPFGTGIGMSNTFGTYNPTQALVNSLLQLGENMFQKYPLGYVFQYTP